MNKYLTGLVAIGTVATVGATSIPASAETIDDIKSAIEKAIENFEVNNFTSAEEIEESCANEMEGYEGRDVDANIQIKKRATVTTPGAALIFIDVDGDELSLRFEKEITTEAAVKITLKDKAKEILENLPLDNYSTGNTIKYKLREILKKLEIEVDVHGFTIAPAVGNTQGVANGTVVLTDYYDNSVVNIPFNLPVLKGTITNDEDNDDSKEEIAVEEQLHAIADALNNLKVSNNTTIDDIQRCANSAVTNANMKVTISKFYLEESTDLEMGEIIYNIDLLDTVNSIERSVMKKNNIDTSATTKLKSLVQAYLSNIVPSNDTTEDGILAGIINAVNDQTIKINIDDFFLKKSSTSDNGCCYFTVELQDKYGNDLYIDYPSKSFTSPNNGNSGNSTAGGSSASGNSGSSNGGSGSSASTNVAPPPTPVITIEQLIPGVVRKEVGKVIEAQVISNIIQILGQGTIAGQAKEVITADGIKISLTPITKGGVGLGSVMVAETASTKATIPVDGGQRIDGVYRYVPALKKYIKVQDAVITADAVTLPVQANATYVASTVVMPKPETIEQGWVQSVDRNWYMVNRAGDLLTGWQQDGIGWTYMSPTNGVMKTGWLQTGSDWYYLKSNGYMATGWINDGSNWYYLDASGAMLANITIDGYTLGSTGAWIK